MFHLKDAYMNSTINGSRQTMANAGRPAVTNR